MRGGDNLPIIPLGLRPQIALITVFADAGRWVMWYSQWRTSCCSYSGKCCANRWRGRKSSHNIGAFNAFSNNLWSWNFDSQIVIRQSRDQVGLLLQSKEGSLLQAKGCYRICNIGFAVFYSKQAKVRRKSILFWLRHFLRKWWTPNSRPSR